MKKYKTPEAIKLYGSRLTLAFEYLKVDATDVAAACGFSQSQVSNWTTGGQRIGLDAALALSEVYNIPLTFIYEGKLDMLDANFRKFVSSSPRDKWAA